MAESTHDLGEEWAEVDIPGLPLFIGGVALPPEAVRFFVDPTQKDTRNALVELGRMMTEGVELAMTIGPRDAEPEQPTPLPFEIFTNEDNQEIPVVSHGSLTNFLHRACVYDDYPAARGVATALWSRLNDLANGRVGRHNGEQDDSFARELHQYTILSPNGRLNYIPTATFATFLDTVSGYLGQRERRNLTMLLRRLQELDNSFDGSN